MIPPYGGHVCSCVSSVLSSICIYIHIYVRKSLYIKDIPAA